MEITQGVLRGVLFFTHASCWTAHMKAGALQAGLARWLGSHPGGRGLGLPCCWCRLPPSLPPLQLEVPWACCLLGVLTLGTSACGGPLGLRFQGLRLEVWERQALAHGSVPRERQLQASDLKGGPLLGLLQTVVVLPSGPRAGGAQGWARPPADQAAPPLLQ